jgi:tetratricopeptide (TPR) repeat protein
MRSAFLTLIILTLALPGILQADEYFSTSCERALALGSEGSIDGAAVMADKAVREESDRPEIRLIRDILAEAKSGRIPRESGALLCKAEILLREGLRAQALQTAQKAMMSTSGENSGWIEVGSIYLAIANAPHGEAYLPEAVRALQKASAKPGNPLQEYFLARCGAAGNDWRSAIAHYDNATQLGILAPENFRRVIEQHRLSLWAPVEDARDQQPASFFAGIVGPLGFPIHYVRKVLDSKGGYGPVEFWGEYWSTRSVYYKYGFRIGLGLILVLVIVVGGLLSFIPRRERRMEELGFPEPDHDYHERE